MRARVRGQKRRRRQRQEKRLVLRMAIEASAGWGVAAVAKTEVAGPTALEWEVVFWIHHSGAARTSVGLERVSVDRERVMVAEIELIATAVLLKLSWVWMALRKRQGTHSYGLLSQGDSTCTGWLASSGFRA
jgi:hypothetical protein